MTEIFVFRHVKRRSDGRTEKSELNHFANRKMHVKLCLGKLIKSYPNHSFILGRYGDRSSMNHPYLDNAIF